MVWWLVAGDCRTKSTSSELQILLNRLKFCSILLLLLLLCCRLFLCTRFIRVHHCCLAIKSNNNLHALVWWLGNICESLMNFSTCVRIINKTRHQSHTYKYCYVYGASCVWAPCQPKFMLCEICPIFWLMAREQLNGMRKKNGTDQHNNQR